MPAFVGQEIEPIFAEVTVARNRAQLAGFVWDGVTHDVTIILRQWQEKSPPRFRRHGRSNRWHVSPFGREYFRVETGAGRVFELFYDRRLAARQITGRWVLWRELFAGDGDGR